MFRVFRTTQRVTKQISQQINNIDQPMGKGRNKRQLIQSTPVSLSRCNGVGRISIIRKKSLGTISDHGFLTRPTHRSDRSARSGHNIRQQHDTMPLPSTFIPIIDNCSKTEEQANQLSIEFNIDFASCIGSLIYLSMTRVDIAFAVNKLEKFTKQPGKIQLKALIHLLHYLQENNNYGTRFYGNIG